MVLLWLAAPAPVVLWMGIIVWRERRWRTPEDAAQVDEAAVEGYRQRWSAQAAAATAKQCRTDATLARGVTSTGRLFAEVGRSRGTLAWRPALPMAVERHQRGG